MRAISKSEMSAGLSILRRPRRLRRTAGIRRMVRENSVTVDDLVLPLFIVDDARERREIGSMPGIYQNRVRDAVEEAVAASKLGIPAVLLFGIPSKKDPTGSGSWDPEGPVQQAIRSMKAEAPELAVIADVCLCEYTDHGHCGVLREEGGVVDVVNAETVELLVRQSLSYAEAGADFVAPSDMMDGRIGRIREALDAKGFASVGVIAYSAKFASGFYGPFREAAESAPRFGDRRSYQMDPANGREAVREVLLDIEEGADMVMVKPALSYLDVIRDAKEVSDVPVVAYNVSGEYAMVKAAAANGWIEGERVMDEILMSIKRAGADLIITYHAMEFARRAGRS
jgi:porphobilinogen synthase